MAKNDRMQNVTKSGITTDADGTRLIPSSVRADGSVRKEIKIRPGYRPPEDIEKYKNRTAEAFRNRGKGDVVGSELANEYSINSSSKGQEYTSNASKSAKRREARKKEAAEKKENSTIDSQKSISALDKNDDVSEELDPEVKRQKEAKKLMKRLRQARELKDKKESGASLLPEQIEKVIRISELIRQLDALGFDSDGQKKACVHNKGISEDP
ncbi:uncharacterized protein PV09_03336 [Verruconis gallopava]|uniref:WIBG Mago-binding domain-containing protein n=1 Tax=Verruconis gallopava TaxID=253628 RepID=A0A0D1YXL5_9PEZI|nr:uncharacterized protein PV09_03336 [Verruconis gallopava]KIW05447.1 hypothetical protein PV09_03336 [Verruconis gallopava]